MRNGARGALHPDRCDLAGGWKREQDHSVQDEALKLKVDFLARSAIRTGTRAGMHIQYSWVHPPDGGCIILSK